MMMFMMMMIMLMIYPSVKINSLTIINKIE